MSEIGTNQILSVNEAKRRAHTNTYNALGDMYFEINSSHTSMIRVSMKTNW